MKLTHNTSAIVAGQKVALISLGIKVAKIIDNMELVKTINKITAIDNDIFYINGVTLTTGKLLLSLLKKGNHDHLLQIQIIEMMQADRELRELNPDILFEDYERIG
jgi:hypothetical protein